MSDPELCKVQTDTQNETALVYNQSRSLFQQLVGTAARDLIRGMNLQPMSKTFLMGHVDAEGQLNLGTKRHRDPGW